MSSSESISSAVLHDLAPAGTLRVGVNCGNVVLVQVDTDTGRLRGIVPALAGELAMRLNVPLEFVRYRNAGAVFDSIGQNRWDVCFLAIEPVRATKIAFTAPYVLIEGTYVVHKASLFQRAADLDAKDIRIGVSDQSAYDLFLTRNLQHAELVRGEGLEGAAVHFREGRVHALAGVRQALDILATQISDVRVLPDRFMSIEQACGTLPGRDAGHNYLQAFIEEVKASGFVARALFESGQTGASVAPAAGPTLDKKRAR